MLDGVSSITGLSYLRLPAGVDWPVAHAACGYSQLAAMLWTSSWGLRKEVACGRVLRHRQFKTTTASWGQWLQVSREKCDASGPKTSPSECILHAVRESYFTVLRFGVL